MTSNKTPEEVRGLVERLTHFVRMLDAKPLRMIDDEFYGIHTGTEWAASIRFSDLRQAAQALTALLLRAETAETEAAAWKADSASAHLRLKEVEREREALRGVLTQIKTWRAECHAFDRDMGYPPRAFGDEDFLKIEALASEALAVSTALLGEHHE